MPESESSPAGNPEENPAAAPAPEADAEAVVPAAAEEPKADPPAAEEVPRVIGHCPECRSPIDVTEISPYTKIECPHCSEPIRVKSQLGNYQITGMLGEGGMSQVFNATDLTLNRKVALKILHQNLNQDQSLISMFEREAQLTASITHENVVKVYTASRDQGFFYIAMELVDNVSVEQIIATQGAMREPRVLDLAHDVTLGLRAAFGEGLIHRDIKPGNMLVTDDGIAKLVDFGLAVVQGGDDESEDLWATPFYVPPEKLDGKKDTFLGDIYSLGATFFHALAGKPPFEANTSSLDELRKIKAQPISLAEMAPTVSKPTVAMVEKMMAYQPEDRPQSYDELLELIEKTITKVPGTTTRLGRAVASPSGPGLPPKKWIGIGAGVAAGIAVIVGIIAAVSGDENDPDPSLIGTEGQVIGGESLSSRYNAGRAALVAGNFREAEAAFDEVQKSGQLVYPTQGWVQFNRGVLELLRGKNQESKAHFEDLAATGDFSKDGNMSMAAQQAFFKKVGNLGSGDFPLLDSDVENLKTENSLDALGFLVAGLKNWNENEFESGAAYLEKFKNSTLPSGYSWVEGFKKQVTAMIDDEKVIKSLPRPVAGITDGEISSMKRELAAAEKTLKSRAARAFANRRLKRCDEISEFRDESNRIAKIANAPVKWPKVAISDDPGSTMKPPPGGNDTPPAPPANGDSVELNTLDFSAEEKSDFDLLNQALSDSNALTSNYLFGAAGLKISTAQLQTARIKAIHKDTVGLYSNAEKFLERFTKEMSSGLEEGIVRRKIGVPLEAKITAAASSSLTVDLGFGETVVPLDKFTPDWILEASLKKFLQPSIFSSATDPELWKNAASFALVTGQTDQANQLASEVRPVSTEFDQIWKRLESSGAMGLTPPESATSPPPAAADDGN